MSAKISMKDTFNIDISNSGKPDFKFTFLNVDESLEEFIPTYDEKYVFDEDAVRTLGIGLELNIPVLIYGLHGSGKTTLAEQFCNRTGRPTMRVQHSIGTEEAEIVGQYIVKDGETQFQYGPLARAMIDGLVFIADEYDFAIPNVLSLYQSALEMKPIFIKSAPPSMALVRPHPNFRFIATGNSNGAGDETGLYQGVNLQNAANYSRFGLTIEMNNLSIDDEKVIIRKHLNDAIPEEELDRLFDFIKHIRNSFDKREITNTISMREIKNITTIAYASAVDGEPDYPFAIEKGYTNRLNSVDAGTVKAVAQRTFG